MYGTESSMFHKMLIFKAGIDFVLGSSLLTSRESIPRRNLFSQEMDYVESMPGVHKKFQKFGLTGLYHWSKQRELNDL
jgi:hypothetical protein